MAYLESSEYVAYGLSADTSDAWVMAASSMMESHCRRGSLLSTSYTERLRVSRQWGTAQLTYGPAGQVTALQARYAPRAELRDALSMEWALTFGLPGQWVTLDPTTVNVDVTSGELRLPPNFTGLRYSEIEVTYTAGLATVPDAVKFACAQIVKNAQATPGLNVKSSKLDTLQTQYFSDSLLDSQVQALLRPYVAERLG
ncbi:MAG TPA: hypothetical protein VKV02_08680 [Acidobacteriaceae bacterium]|nr:hypothetical protein [Acidobacteriaceae bacterium]